MPAEPEAPRPSAAPPPGPALAEAGALTLPNLITLARLCAVPGTIWLIMHGRLDWAFVLFAAAGISDAIDGWIARRWHLRSRLGAMLDPLADKALMTGAYVTLAITGMIPDWLAILVVFRDLLILGGVVVLWLLGTAPQIRPLRISKVNTAAQIAFAGLTLLVAGFGPGPGPAMEMLAWGVAATTAASGLAYLREAGRQVR
ncbi:CDP-alcohol phosphatidyltransferase family protein [Roseomonas marmotae]|uniref:CDP-alcohol phosphatidyltransferase family protein n=1 Tax=Roseomonas marmotae TaxID=2768161 RepID=UPI001F01EC0C|nr:CDP-alcohol phosphatidyltransferase family protein [Roseomonas marmotae]